MPRGKKDTAKSEVFIGLFRLEDTESEIARLGDIDDYFSFITDDRECQLDRSDGKWKHTFDCLTDHESDGTCIYEKRTKARRYLSRLQTRLFLSMLFCNPSLAPEHESMDEQELMIRPL